MISCATRLDLVGPASPAPSSGLSGNDRDGLRERYHPHFRSMPPHFTLTHRRRSCLGGTCTWDAGCRGAKTRSIQNCACHGSISTRPGEYRSIQHGRGCCDAERKTASSAVDTEAPPPEAFWHNRDSRRAATRKAIGDQATRLNDCRRAPPPANGCDGLVLMALFVLAFPLLPVLRTGARASPHSTNGSPTDQGRVADRQLRILSSRGWWRRYFAPALGAATARDRRRCPDRGEARSPAVPDFKDVTVRTQTSEALTSLQLTSTASTSSRRMRH